MLGDWGTDVTCYFRSLGKVYFLIGGLDFNVFRAPGAQDPENQDQEYQDPEHQDLKHQELVHKRSLNKERPRQIELFPRHLESRVNVN